jgi:2-polyprenyl-6-methoxyphenol hydroxylase-like FAD-dependent oxidoreductase
MRTAIVCGSGIAGLAAAIGLARHGWSIDVYERSSSVREIGAGIFIKGNAQRVLWDFAVADQIRRDGIVLREARTLDQNGVLLQRRLLRDATVIWNAKREHVIRALYQRAIALGTRIHTDATVESIDPGGSVSISGQSLRADLIIAADGVHSRARHMLGFGYFIAPLDDERGTRVPIDKEYWSARFPALAAEGFFERARAAASCRIQFRAAWSKR